MAFYIDWSSYERFHPIFECWDENIPHERQMKTWLLHLREARAGTLGLFKNELNNLLKVDEEAPNANDPVSSPLSQPPSKPYPLIYSLASVRPKMYSLQICSSQDTPSQIEDKPGSLSIRRLKGIGRRTVRRQLRHENYLRCLRTAIPQRHAMVNIRSFRHKLYITRTSKISLSAFEDKREWYSPLHSFPYRNKSKGDILKKVRFYEDSDLEITNYTPNEESSQIDTV